MKNTSPIHFVGSNLISAKIICILFLLSNFSLDIRRLKFTLQNIVKLKANIDNPAFDCVFNPQYENLYNNNKKCIESICFRIQKHIDDSSKPIDIIKPLKNPILKTTKT